MSCNKILQREGLAYPRACARCGLGPCAIILNPAGANDLRARAREIANAPHAFASVDVTAIIYELLKEIEK